MVVLVSAIFVLLVLADMVGNQSIFSNHKMGVVCTFIYWYLQEPQMSAARRFLQTNRKGRSTRSLHLIGLLCRVLFTIPRRVGRNSAYSLSSILNNI